MSWLGFANHFLSNQRLHAWSWINRTFPWEWVFFSLGNSALSVLGLFLFCFCLVWGEQFTDAQDFGWYGIPRLRACAFGFHHWPLPTNHVCGAVIIIFCFGKLGKKTMQESERVFNFVTKQNSQFFFWGINFGQLFIN